MHNNENPNKGHNDLDIILNRISETFGRHDTQKIPTIEMDDFKDLYGAGVQADEEEVLRLRQEFVASLDNMSPEELDYFRLGKAFELIALDQMATNKWLGNGAIVQKTSKFDDYKNGADAIAHFIKENSPTNYLALSIDITTSHNLSRKFRRLQNEIKNRTLTGIKYFKSDSPKFRGHLEEVPRVVIGADPKITKEMMALWANSKDAKAFDKKYLDELNQELREHEIQIIILLQILAQLEAYTKYAEELEGEARAKANKISNQPEISETEEEKISQYTEYADDYKRIAQTYTRDISIIKEVMNKKGFSENKIVKAMQDGVYQTILENLTYFHAKDGEFDNEDSEIKN